MKALQHTPLIDAGQVPAPHHSLELGTHGRAIAYGKPYDWSLNSLLAPQDLRNGELALFDRIRVELMAEGVFHAYAPRLRSFNAKTAAPRDFGIVIQRGGLQLYRGAEASGMLVPRGAALLLPTGDCPTVVMHDPLHGDIVAFHAGLGELINLKPYKPEFPSPHRSYDSILEKGAQHFDPKWRKRIEIHVLCGISPRGFTYPSDHQKFGETNKRIKAHIAKFYGSDVFAGCDIDTGAIDLVTLVRSQAQKFGFDPSKVSSDGICTAADRERWHSNVRDGKTAGRNMVMVIRA
jgi:hypothetical protein